MNRGGGRIWGLPSTVREKQWYVWLGGRRFLSGLQVARRAHMLQSTRKQRNSWAHELSLSSFILSKE